MLTAPVLIHAAAWPKIEASFNIAGLATDPFDYAVTDVRVQIQMPDAAVLSLPAFFDGGTTWRVRHTPTNTGVYQVTGVTLNGAPQSVSNLQPASWTVSGPPVGGGFVRIDPSNARRFVTDDGRRYFPVGENVAWDQGVNVTAAFGKSGPARMNWARVWMNHWDGKNLDWPNTGAVLPRGQLSLTVAQKWDAIVAAAEQNGVCFQLALQHHGQYSMATDPNWNMNPYNSAVTSLNGFPNTNGFLVNPVQFFTNSLAKDLTKRKLRYAVARWGYSPSIMAWELFNEVQWTTAAQTGQWTIIGQWHDEMAAFLRAQDPYQHLITTSSDNFSQPIWTSMDFYQYHNYASDVVTSARDGQEPPGASPIRPNFSGESTPQSNVTGSPRIWVQAAVWPSLMSTHAGAACPWWWDYSDAQTNYASFRAVRDFVSLSGLGDQNGLVKSAPTITGGVISALEFSPGGGFGTNTGPDTFTVGSGAPDGIGFAPSYLQGDYHRTDYKMTNGYVFLVNYPQSGTFSVEINQIAAAGAGLQIFRDNILQTNIAFPGTGSDVSTNFVAGISVSAGAHTIKIYNPGLDWVLLGDIRLDPYVPSLGAYTVGNPGFNATWVWHRTNLLAVTAGPAVAGTVDVGGLDAGTYSATWWDAVNGKALTNFNLNVAVSNSPITIATPSILRSAALFVGRAPQAAVIAPSLVQTLGTNSPALTLPLIITNNGGLPLSYSLSITGATPLAYSAVNSTQPGGPVYSWKDITGTGKEISANFTALAAPKVARDEGIAGPFDIGFAFPFFNGAQSSATFTQLYVSPNGFITFSPFASDTSTNRSLPGALAPTNLIAFFWDDLDLSTGTGRAWVDSDPIGGTFTLQFQNVRFKSSASTATCELILKTTGEILIQYSAVTVSNACTVGVQNAAASQGLQVAFNGTYVRNNFAVRLMPVSWLGLSGHTGIVPGSDADSLDVSLDPAGLAYGTYQATAVVRTGDPAQSLFVLPVELDITPIATWRQSHFGIPGNSGIAADTADPDADGLMNILEYAFNADPNVSSPPPLSFALVGDHLRITFQRKRPAPADITYIYEVTDDLASGNWQSGPAFTTQNVVDNLNGTETVTVIDNTPVSATDAHYLRVRISVP